MTTGISELQNYAKTRDADVFAQLVQTHADMVYGVCLRVLGNAADAEDAAQECFLRLAREAGRIHTSLPAWLHRCATNEAITRRRQAKSRARLVENFVRDGAGSKDPDEMTWAEMSPHVDRALDELPDELRYLLVEHFLRRRPQGELAEEKAVSAATMSRRIAEGVDLLRRKLKVIGVIVPAVILADLMMAKTATAATPALAAGLGKMALAGVGAGHGVAAAAGTTVVGKLVLIAGSVCGVLVLTVVVGLVYAAARAPRMTASNEPAPVQLAQPPMPVQSADAGIPADPETENLSTEFKGFQVRVEIVQLPAGTSIANNLRIILVTPGVDAQQFVGVPGASIELSSDTLVDGRVPPSDRFDSVAGPKSVPIGRDTAVAWDSRLGGKLLSGQPGRHRIQPIILIAGRKCISPELTYEVPAGTR